jgi:hypothetical protein
MEYAVTDSQEVVILELLCRVRLTVFPREDVATYEILGKAWDMVPLISTLINLSLLYLVMWRPENYQICENISGEFAASAFRDKSADASRAGISEKLVPTYQITWHHNEFNHSGSIKHGEFLESLAIITISRRGFLCGAC